MTETLHSRGVLFDFILSETSRAILWWFLGAHRSAEIFWHVESMPWKNFVFVYIWLLSDWNKHLRVTLGGYGSCSSLFNRSQGCVGACWNILACFLGIQKFLLLCSTRLIQWWTFNIRKLHFYLKAVIWEEKIHWNFRQILSLCFPENTL